MVKQIMLQTLLLGVAASIAAELVTWGNEKLSGTVLKGDAALLLSAGVAFVFAFGQALTTNSFTLASLGTSFAQVWATAQVFFVVVVQSLNLDVKSA